MNKAILIGNLVSDPEVKKTTTGKSVCQMRIGVQREYKNADGNYESDFFSIVAWNTTADYCGKYLKKGNKVAVDGRIETRSYDAQDGTKRYVTEIIANSIQSLTPRTANNDDAKAAPNYDKKQTAEPKNEFTPDDEELPF